MVTELFGFISVYESCNYFVLTFITIADSRRMLGLYLDWRLFYIVCSYYFQLQAAFGRQTIYTLHYKRDFECYLYLENPVYFF